MGPEYWRAAENVSAVYAKALGAVKSVEALTSLRHLPLAQRADRARSTAAY